MNSRGKRAEKEKKKRGTREEHERLKGHDELCQCTLSFILLCLRDEKEKVGSRSCVSAVFAVTGTSMRALKLQRGRSTKSQLFHNRCRDITPFFLLPYRGFTTVWRMTSNTTRLLRVRGSTHGKSIIWHFSTKCTCHRLRKWKKPSLGAAKWFRTEGFSR